MPRRSPYEQNDESRKTLEAVLRDQAERERRRTRASAAPTGSPKGRLGLTLVLVFVAVSLWLSPPPFLRPSALPDPGPDRIESGLRMDMWVAVQRLRDFQGARRRLPVTLQEFVTEPGEGVDLSYERISPEVFRLEGYRSGVEVTYESTMPLEELVGAAVRTLVTGGAR